MDILILALLISVTVFVLNSREQRKRIILLATHLSNYQIEKLMAALSEGYLRALGETTDERRAQVWSFLSTTESQLNEQFGRFANEFSRLDEVSTRISRLPIALPMATQLFPKATFDMRKALRIHAQGIDHVLQHTSHLSNKDRAFMMTAELFLMQHTCHWFCKSKTIASARMMSRHQTPHQQLVDSVSAPTRQAYLALINGQ